MLLKDNSKKWAKAMKARMSGKEPRVKAVLPTHKKDPIKKGGK